MNKLADYPDDIIRKAIEVCDCLVGFTNEGDYECVAAALLQERQKIASDLFNRDGFMLCEGGDKPKVTVSFRTLKETQEFHRVLVDLSKWKTKGEVR